MPLNHTSLKDILKQKIDLHVVVGHYVSLKQTSKGYIGLCPFHQEKTPSFHVYQDQQVFYCFGCRASGDIITFKMKKENLSFPEALESLAEEFHIEIPKTSQKTDATKMLYLINSKASEWFEKQLQGSHGENARKYLKQRNIDSETIKKFHIGFAPDDWQALKQFLEKQKAPLSLAERLGLIKTHPQKKTIYDTFRNRIMFPIFDARNRVVGFGGRTLDTQSKLAKYMNSSASIVYQKDNEFYTGPDSFHAIRKTKKAIIVEGYFDLISLYQKGIANVLASCGTALTATHARPTHVRNLKRIADEVIIFYDNDNAGKQAAKIASELCLKEGMTVRICYISKEKDPDEFCQKHSSEEVQKVIDNAKPFIQCIIHEEKQKLQSASSKNPIEDKVSSVRRITKDLTFVQDEMEKKEWVRLTSREIQIPEDDIWAMLFDNQQPKENSKKLVSQQSITEYYRPELTFIILVILNSRLIEHFKEKEINNLLDVYFSKGNLHLQNFFSACMHIKKNASAQESTSIHDILVFFQDGGIRDFLVSTLCGGNVLEEFPIEKHEVIFQDCVKKIQNRFLKKQKQRIEKELRQNEHQPEIAESLLKKKIEIDKEITTLASK